MIPLLSSQRFRVYFLLAIFVCLCVGVLISLELKRQDYNMADHMPTEAEVAPFPVGVNPQTETITELGNIEVYQIDTELLLASSDSPIRKAMSDMLYQFAWYQQLAAPMSRVLVIWPGERKEEIVDNFGDILGWDAAERTRFEISVTESVNTTIAEGIFPPGRYVVTYNATPEAVAQLLTDRLEGELLARYSEEVAAQVPLEDALKIASLIEREAHDFTDMRYISGVIWNRLFIEMPLQLDASLQYAKGSNPYEAYWWPKVVPQDKFIESPYNTYQNEGLPPGPIANPSLSAVLAALNPRMTDCMFYFHEDDGTFHCSVTYEEHVAKLKKLYGQGR